MAGRMADGVRAGLSRLSIRLKVMLLLLVLVVLTGAVYTSLLVRARKQALIAETDARLLAAAVSARGVVGWDYHDRIEGPESVSPVTYARIVSVEALAKPPATLRLTACVAGRFVR